MKLTKEQLKQIIKEELSNLEEAGYLPDPDDPEYKERMADWMSGFTGNPNDPLLSTARKRTEKRKADLEAAKTLVSAMDPKELEQLQQHISGLSAEGEASSSDSDEDAEGVEALDVSSSSIEIDPLKNPPWKRRFHRRKPPSQ